MLINLSILINSINFKCTHNKTNWTGKINDFKNYGSHYEMRIESRSGITVLFGKTSMGSFACMPDFSAGCHLAELDNEFYSKQKLFNVINPVDAITVARALSFATKQFVGSNPLQGGFKNHV
jgi:hypothetical protein